MLIPETPFPQIGSYALFVDRGLPLSEQTHEIVRILARDWNLANGQISIAFPLRAGASGNQRVDLGDLIDGTPLNATERRELADLERQLSDCSMRTPRQKALGKHRDRLRQRAMYAPIMAGLLRRAQALAATKRKAA